MAKELGAREAERVMWDVIVVGTGMGGGMLGYRLARSGRQGAVRREGALHVARHAGNDSRGNAGAGRTTARAFGNDVLRRLGPGRTLY